MRRLRIGLLDSHPIQYHAPWFRALAEQCDLRVFFAYQPSAAQQGLAGYGVAFDWDLDLLTGYEHTRLANIARNPNVDSFAGCDTPEIAEHIGSGAFDAMIVSGWYLKSSWQAVLACKRYGVPVFARGDSHLGRPRGKLKLAAKQVVYPPLLRSFDGFLSAGQRHREYLLHYAVPVERIHFVPRFVDNDYFREHSNVGDATRAQLRAAMGVTSNAERIALFVGRFIDLKRPVDLLHAIAASELRTQVVAAFAGAGALESEIRNVARHLGVRAVVLGFQNQSQLPRVYAAADFLVLPSAEESWGLVINEAMACGRPVIATDVIGCVPDLIDTGKTGQTYPAGDTRALARALERMEGLLARSDLQRDLHAKMDVYSCRQATRGTLTAIQSVLR